MRLALFQPDIPQNTGTILRLAACLEVAVDLILPTGFDSSDRNLKRAGLDYLDRVTIQRHDDFAAFLAWRRETRPAARIVLATTHGATSHIKTAFRHDDILLLGRESAGAPDYVHTAADLRVRIPLTANVRSLNIAVAAAMLLGEALRQTDGFPVTAMPP
jgi:tRNA (cytidine/uridine-2'-O-)-methyltransferase